MTWGEFKEVVDETKGITDDSRIWYIDINYPPGVAGLEIVPADEKDGMAVWC
jgi:hypothetical protein